VVGHIDWKDTTGTGVAGSNLTGTAFEAGGSVAPGHLTVHGNFYYGKAIGQQFAHITQTAPAQGDIRGWGAWAQAGYDFTPHWSFLAFYGLEPTGPEALHTDHPTATLAPPGESRGRRAAAFPGGPLRPGA